MTQIYQDVVVREKTTKNKVCFGNARIGVVYVPKDMLSDGVEVQRIRVTWETLEDGETG